MITVKITITLNGQEQDLSYEDGKKLFEELKVVYDNEKINLYYPPGVRGGITDAILNKKETYIDNGSGVPITANLGDDENNINPTYGGVRTFSEKRVSGSVSATGVEDVKKEVDTGMKYFENDGDRKYHPAVEAAKAKAKEASKCCGS